MAQIPVERISGPEPAPPASVPPLPWYRQRRVLVFAAVAAATLLLGWLIVFLRPAIYQAGATLLTTPPPAVDADEVVVDPQHIAIQRVLLTGQPLLEETLERLEWDGRLPPGLTPAAVREMLRVEPVPDTNLVRLIAEGPDRDLLAPLVNTWVEVYREVRAREIEASTGATLRALRERLAALQGKIAARRKALEDFRQRYDIASLERGENTALARLNGLTEALNKANEAVVEARSRLEAVKAAVAAGKPVVPEEDQQVLAVLEQRAQALREQLTAMKQRFTPQYIRLNPAYRKVPQQLREVEAKIAALVERGRRAVLAQAQQDYAAALQTVAETRRQLEAHKRQAQEFSTRFAEHESLVKDLEQLEEQQRELQARITQLEVKQLEQYPQVEVVEKAYAPESPIRPHYWRDAGVVALLAFGLGLAAVWLLEFLTRREARLPDTRLTLAGVHVYADPRQAPLFSPPPPAEALRTETAPERLPSQPQELDTETLNRLIDRADLKTRQTVALLLSGLTPEELTRLETTDVDLAHARLLVPPPHRRSLPLAPRLKTWLAASGGTPLVPGDPEAVRKLLYLAAVEAGLEDPESVTPEALRHACIVHLLRQGLKLARLEAIVGPLTLKDLSRYRPLTIAADKDVDQIDPVHPCLRS
ncbi:polysaccharide biosynthesis transport protein [Methylomarinovum tepidoasis]|uniref:Polysaccharide biosynthesis transport protein n=1 Tax=Methylomarinovum tepidoasis TaxID=2840183 RepID=A0AAU9CGA4_9GAMM|nr:integrase [Methylomarinovum sp. IN45]BCX88356.1 polysaccharide biosynthesis transport protein [Methylomarinovum sp. IN45]